MSRFVPLISLLLMAVSFCWADDPKEMKPADIKTFVPTPEPMTVPEDLRKPGVFDDEYPIPQDKAKAEKNRADWRAWWKKQTVDAFDANGDKSAPWAPKAKAALEAMVAFKSAVNLKNSLVLDPAVEGTRQALIDECTDPLVRYFAFTWHGVNGVPEKGTTQEIAAFIDPLLKGKYPLTLKSRAAWETAVRFEKIARTQELATKYYDEFWKHYVELAKSKDRLDQDFTVELGRNVEQQYVDLGQKRQDGHTAVVKALDMAKVDIWVKQTVEGNYKYFSALDAKLSDAADASKLVKERLASARKAYQAAWEANKDMPEAAGMMIAVCKEESSTRDEMEAWFTKAMTADPDSLVACQTKLAFLRTGEKGFEKIIVAFGRQCFRTKNHYAGLDYLLDDAHRIAGSRKGRDYYAESEPWADLRELFETRLKAIPTDRYARTRYGAICLAAGEGPGAFQHLSSVKALPWPGIISRFEGSLKDAEQLAREQTEKP